MFTAIADHMIVHALKAESRIIDADLTVGGGHVSGAEHHRRNIMKASITHHCAYVKRMLSCDQNMTPTNMTLPGHIAQQGGTEAIQQPKDLCHLKEAMSQM